MWVGMGRIVLDFYGNTDGAKKRRLIDEFCADLRKQHFVSAREVADFDDLERCVIGISVVMPEDWNEARTRGLMEKIGDSVDRTAFARVTIEDYEITEFGGEPLASDETPYSESELKQFRKGPRRFLK